MLMMISKSMSCINLLPPFGFLFHMAILLRELHGGISVTLSSRSI